MPDQPFKIRGFQQDIRIHVADEVVLYAFEELATAAECEYFRAKITTRGSGYVQGANEPVLARIVLNDLASAICGIVTDNHPPLRQPCLAQYTSNAGVDEILFVVRGGHQDIWPEWLIFWVLAYRHIKARE